MGNCLDFFFNFGEHFENISTHFLRIFGQMSGNLEEILGFVFRDFLKSFFLVVFPCFFVLSFFTVFHCFSLFLLCFAVFPSFLFVFHCFCFFLFFWTRIFGTRPDFWALDRNFWH